jgi:hypothetical protein
MAVVTAPLLGTSSAGRSDMKWFRALIAAVSVIAIAGCASTVPSAAPKATATPAGATLPAPEASTLGPSPSTASTPSPGALDARGCPTDPDTSLAQLKELDHGLVVGGRHLDHDGTLKVQALNGSYGGEDAIPAFASLDLAAKPIPAKAGGTLTVREASLTLVGLTARRYDLDGFHTTNGIDYTGPAPRRLTTTVKDGTGSIEIPDRAGRYVIELSPTWRSDCFLGEGVTWVVVRVR